MNFKTLILFSFLIVLLGLLYSSTFFMQLPESTEYSPEIMVELEEYRPLINYLAQYKTKNNVYPNNISEMEGRFNNFPYFEYKTTESMREYILIVSKQKEMQDAYKYCSTRALGGCKPVGRDSRHKVMLTGVGQWIHQVKLSQ